MQKMINFDDVTKGNMKNHSSNWPQSPNHPYGVLMILASLSGKTIHCLI